MERRIDTGTPVADHVLKLLDGAKISYAVAQACELQLFDEVHKSTGSATTAAQLAKHKTWEPDALKRLMDAMVSVKLLSKTQHDDGEDSYENTEGGRMLVKDGPPALYECALSTHDDITTMRELANTIKKGPSKIPEETGEWDCSEGECPPEFAMSMYRMCEGIAQPHTHQIMTAIDLSKHKKAVDLGGGTGVYSYALLKAYPKMEVILGELPSVLPVVEEHFINKNKDPRLSTLAVDYNTDTLPKADLYLLANILNHHDADKCKEVVTKIHGALNPGGAIMIVDILVNDNHDGPPMAHVLGLTFPGTGNIYTGKEMATILHECNFGDIQIVKTQEYCIADIIYGCKK